MVMGMGMSSLSDFAYAKSSPAIHSEGTDALGNMARTIKRLALSESWALATMKDYKLHGIFD